MKGLMGFGLGCSAAAALVGLFLTATIVFSPIGFPLAVLGVLGLVGFAIAYFVVRDAATR